MRVATVDDGWLWRVDIHSCMCEFVKHESNPLQSHLQEDALLLVLLFFCADRVDFWLHYLLIV
jgi:hypothetical protein